MLIMRTEDETFEIKIEELEDSMRVIRECPCGCGNEGYTDIPYEEFYELVEDGIIDILDEDELCECPMCRIERQIEELSEYLDEAIDECEFEEVKLLTESIKNLMEIKEMM